MLKKLYPSTFKFFFFGLILMLAAIGLPRQAEAGDGALGNFVWKDINRNGIQDAGEPGITGVTVELYNCSGVLLATTTTNSDGLYIFAPLTSSISYYIKFIPPAGYLFTLQNQGADDLLDSDANPSTGQTACALLESREIDYSWDAGLYYPVCENPGTGTPGYWKNHPVAWPANSIMIGGVSYPKESAISYMMLPVQGDKTLTMFRALVSAKLNLLIGNDGSCIAATVAAADEWMEDNMVGIGVKADSLEWKEGEPLYQLLDQYNNGYLCAPHRD